MPIGEFSARSGLSQKRLRSYAAAGLLIPAAVDSDSGYRYYAPGQLRDAQVIDALRRADVPLSIIKKMLHDPGEFDYQQLQRELDDASAVRRAALEEARELIAQRSEHPGRRKGNSMTTLTIAARTETGPTRADNQDAAIIGDRLAGVADGMGGAPGGQIAASLAAAVFETSFEGSAVEELAAIARSANAAIFHRAVADSSLTGMGTTLCCAGLVADELLAVVNVGDSRAYLLHGGDLRQITEDHTVPAEMVRLGQLEKSEATHHPNRHVLTRVLGGGPTVQPDTMSIDVTEGDLLMLCTDGLWKDLTTEDIFELMSREGTPSEIADRLVDRALAAGGDDNITVVVALFAHLSPAE